MNYYMAGFIHSEIDSWHPCKSKTLRNAKRETSIRYNEWYGDAVLKVASSNDGIGFRILSARSNMPKSKWINELS